MLLKTNKKAIKISGRLQNPWEFFHFQEMNAPWRA